MAVATGIDLLYYEKCGQGLWVKIVWDEPKRLTNLHSRRLDFADIDPLFLEGATIISAKFGRRKAICPFGDLMLAVIFQPLGSEAVSIVSMRRASSKERQIYARWQD